MQYFVVFIFVDMQCTQRYVSSFCLTVFFSMLFYQIEDSRYYLMNLLFDWLSLWRIYADWRAGPIDWNLRPHHRFKPASFGLCKNKWNNVYKIPCLHFILNLDFLKKKNFFGWFTIWCWLDRVRISLLIQNQPAANTEYDNKINERKYKITRIETNPPKRLKNATESTE